METKPTGKENGAGKDTLPIDLKNRPNVLLFGNGMLKLGNSGTGWDALLQSIKTASGPVDVSGVPYAMQPEALCGVDVEEVQRKTANEIETLTVPHPLVKELLALPFDAILTTNYTYEVEEILSGKTWTETRRRNSFRALWGSPHVRHNTFACNLVQTPDGRSVPVFHIHGEKARKHSMTLSYYSYADSLSRLVGYNKEQLKNRLEELQQEGESKPCQCWLDYFLIGNVYAVGFGFDVSEFDIWWAIERKAREHATHGDLTAFMEEAPGKDNAQRALFEAMNVIGRFIPVKDKDYAGYYGQAVKEIMASVQRDG